MLGFFQKGHLAVERMLCLVNGTGNGGLTLDSVEEGIGLTDKDIIPLKIVVDLVLPVTIGPIHDAQAVGAKFQSEGPSLANQCEDGFVWVLMLIEVVRSHDIAMASQDIDRILDLHPLQRKMFHVTG